MLKAFIDPTIFFNKLSHLYFNLFNKLRHKAFPMKAITYLMADLTSENSGFFEIFILNLKSEIPRISFICAQNIENILENYDIPAEKYGPLLLQQVIDILKSGKISRALPEHQQVLKNIVFKLSTVLEEEDFCAMIRPLFESEKTMDFIENLSVDELCNLIQKFEIKKTNAMMFPPKKRLSKNGQSSFISMTTRKKSARDMLRRQETKEKKTLQIKEQRLIKPVRLYQKIQKLFAVCGTLKTFFKRVNPGYAEYLQNVLLDFEKKFETDCNVKLSFFVDPKDPFRIEKCSHYSIEKLRNELLQRNPESDSSGKVAYLNNKSILLSAAKELINILEVEKLEKQSGNWEMVMPLAPDKKSVRQFRPKGQCLATLFSNRGRIKVMTKGKDKKFFSGSDQGEIRVFDFNKFSEEGESLLRSKIDMNTLMERSKNPRKNSFSTCPDT